MRAPLSWLAEYADLPPGLTAEQVDATFVRLGLEIEHIQDTGSDLSGPLVVGEVLEIEELTGFKKPIRYCQVRVGPDEVRGIVCGAANFAVGDRVVAALPGSVLPGGFAISARTTYGRVSDGMICSTRELGLGQEHDGILVLDDAPEVGVDAVVALGLADVVVDLNVTPDRGYCLSVRGLARELAQGLGVFYRDPAAIAAADPADGPPPYDVRVLDAVGCPRFTAGVVEGVDPTRPSPLWLTRRLAAAGIRTISLAVDVTNYVMLELGQPMHAFDRDRVAGPLVVRRARDGERLRTLDGVDRVLDPEDLLITDDSGPIGLAAVMGGASTEVIDTTSAVLLEAAHWDPVTVARTARRHRLPSEASRRFERGVDPELTTAALARATALLVEYGGGRAVAGRVDLDQRMPRLPILLDTDLPGRVAGVPYPPETVVGSLRAIGCEVEGDAVLSVRAPSWRPDLVDPQDLCEEVVRVDGYDQVPSVLPVTRPGRGLTAGQRRRRSLGRTLAEAGYVEAPSDPFMSKAVLDALGLDAEDSRRRAVRLANPVSDEAPLLRTTLLPGLLDALARNRGRGQRDLALFEVGLVFQPGQGVPPPPMLGVDRRPDAAETAALYAGIPPQPWHVAVALTGLRQPAGWWGTGQPVSWADAVEAARAVAAAAGVDLTVRAGRQAPWHPGRCAELVVGGRTVGWAGELHPGALAALELPRGSCAMELDLDALPEPEVVPARSVSVFPAALVDVALVVPDRVPAADVQAALVAGGSERLESVRLFDVFTGAQVADGHRSLAYALVLRAPDRTLTGEEVTAARDAAVAEATRRTGARLRA